MPAPKARRPSSRTSFARRGRFEHLMTERGPRHFRRGLVFALRPGPTGGDQGSQHETLRDAELRMNDGFTKPPPGEACTADARGRSRTRRVLEFRTRDSDDSEKVRSHQLRPWCAPCSSGEGRLPSADWVRETQCREAMGWSGARRNAMQRGEGWSRAHANAMQRGTGWSRAHANAMQRGEGSSRASSVAM